MPAADARTIVVGGAATMSAHATLTDTFTITGLDSTQFGSGAKVAYNAPVYQSGGVSGFSQAVSGFGIAVSPAPTATSGPLTDPFGNPYYRYEWSLAGYAPDSLTVTITTSFDIAATGDPYPESFGDPYPVAAPGMGQFLARTDKAQSDDPRIAGAATSLAAGVATEAAAVDRIVGFVKEHVANGVNPADDAVSTLTTGTGYCTHRANLALALLRAAGIPARFVNGAVCSVPYAVGFTAPEGQGTIEAGWYAQQAHSWIEAYFPAKGWVGYDPYLNFGFVDHRHVKGGTALDSDVLGRTTGGLGTLFEIVELNQGIDYHHAASIAFSQVSDTGGYTFRTLKEPPGGGSIYVLGRDMVNAPTPTPTPIPTPSPAPVPTATPTPAPNATAVVTPTPTPGTDATASPSPGPAGAAAPADLNTTAGAGDGTFSVSGVVVDGATGKALGQAKITIDGRPVPVDGQGAYSARAANGTHTLDVSAPGYGSLSMSVTVAGSGVVQAVRLNAAAASPAGRAGLPIVPCLGLAAAAVVALIIIALYRHGRA